MNKAQRIRELFTDGITSTARIAELTGFGVQYVRTVVSDMRDPGRRQAVIKAYWERRGRHERALLNERWRKRNRAAANASRRAQYRRRQQMSKVTAWNRNKDWNLKELRFIRRNRFRLTTAQIAQAIGRTWRSVRVALATYRLNASTERPLDKDWNVEEVVG